MIIEMNKQIDELGKNHSIEILIALAKKDKMFYSELKDNLDVGGNTSISSRLTDLKKIGLIQDKKEETTAKGKYIGVKRYIWLTDKGKHIAEKLVEIEEMLEEK